MSKLAVLGSKIAAFNSKHPIIRGMISYGVLWPTSCLITQTYEGKRWGTYNWAECARYSLYGSCFTAPTLFLWVKISTRIWPKSDIKTAMVKALIEQVSYGPAAMACFFFGMSLLKQQTVEESVKEVQAKFLPTYKIGCLFWPFLQTINFCFVPEKNRVVYVSVCSLVWASFLAYMKEIPAEKLAKMKEETIP